MHQPHIRCSTCTHCALCLTLIRDAAFYNGNDDLPPGCGGWFRFDRFMKLVAPEVKSRQNRNRRNLRGVRYVQQVYAIHPDRDGAGHRDGQFDLQLPPRQPRRNCRRRQFDRNVVPAPDQDDHRAPGVRDPGRRHRPYGQRCASRPHLRQDHGLVRQRIFYLAAARPRDGQSAAARRQFPRHLAGQGGLDGIADIGLFDREVSDPSDSDFDRRRDGAERDPADRGVRGILFGGARCTAGALQADALADR